MRIVSTVPCSDPHCDKPVTHVVCWQIRTARSPGYWYGCEEHAKALAAIRETRDELVYLHAY